jgi:hypothetical protein
MDASCLGQGHQQDALFMDRLEVVTGDEVAEVDVELEATRLEQP